MKAKEYYNKFQTENLDKETSYRVAIVFRLLAIEISTIIKARNAHTDAACLSVVKEVNQKANAFIKMINEDSKNNFERNKNVLNIFYFQTNSFLRFLHVDIPSVVEMIAPELKGSSSGNCEHCGTFKENKYGLCISCGKFPVKKLKD